MSDTSTLQAVGIRPTPPRMKVLNLFRESPVRHLSAEDVHKSLIDDAIGIATIYRLLAQFEAAGILKRSHFREAGKAVFELNEGDHHDHLLCVDCGLVVEFSDPEIDRRQQFVATQMGFEIRECSLLIHGTCARQACPNKPAWRHAR